MEQIEKIEMAVGKKLEQWNISDLENLSLTENKDILESLKDEKVLNELIQRTYDNEDVCVQFSVLYTGSQLHKAEEKGNDILQQLEDKKISSDEAEKQIVEMYKNEFSNVYEKLVGYLIAAKAFNVDLKSEIENIERCIDVLKYQTTDLVKRDLVSFYNVIMDLFDLIFPLRTFLFDKYSVDVLNDDSLEFKKVLDEIADYQKSTIDEVQKLFENNNQQQNNMEDK